MKRMELPGHGGAALLLLALAACGGGGAGGSLVSTPVVAPSPTPTPTPAPTPTSTFLGTAHVSSVFEAGTETLADGTIKITSIGGTGYPAQLGTGNLERRGPNSYAVELAGMGGPEFPPASFRGSDAVFDHYRTIDSQDEFANLSLARKGAGITLTYATFGNMAYSVQPAFTGYVAELVFFSVGQTTLASQVPRSGTAAFRGIADGLWIDGATVRRLYGSPAHLTADFAGGQVTSVLELRGHGDAFGDFLSTGTTALGTFTGTGPIAGSYFRGNYAPANGWSGKFEGQFYGPAAEESGWSFSLDGAPGQRVVGAAVAGR